MSRVANRWGLPEKAPFYALPESALLLIAARCTPLEERILHRILAAWDWSGDADQHVSENCLAKQCHTTRRSVRRALTDLAGKGLLEFYEQGQGQPPTVSTRPLRAIVLRRPKLVAARHKLTKGSLVAAEHKSDTDDGRAAQLVAKEHKHLSRESTSEPPPTCILVASRVGTQSKEPESSRRAGEPSPASRAGSPARGEARNEQRFEERRAANLRALAQMTDTPTGGTP